MDTIWQQDPEAKPVSYLKEMLTSQASFYGLLGSLALGVVIAFPFGFKLAAIPLLLFIAGEAVAALFVPNSTAFRHRVDRAKRGERRERARQYLIQEIERRVEDDSLWEVYAGLCERLEALQQMIRNRKTTLSDSDLERLADATVDFLGLWLGRITMAERLGAPDEKALRDKLQSITAQLENVESAANRRHLQQAKTDLERILARRERLIARQAAVEAAQLSLADTFDEVYQGVMTNPTSGDIGRQLQEAVERLHIEEDLDLSVDEAMETAVGKPEAWKPDRDRAPRLAAALGSGAREPRR